MPDAPRRIRPLPDLVANQIAAGEVVERPASVVKELVENALDAGAARLAVDLEQGGIELIRVTDDGSGIDPDDLSLALAPHATSKIDRAEDLDGVVTLGFRGEALASIASVSRLCIRTRRPADPGAWALASEGDRRGEPAPAAGPVGTSVEVRNLFFNTPARRKFLRTPATEQGHALDVIRQLAMVHARVGFVVRADAREVLALPADQSPRERVLDILGRDLEKELLEVSRDGAVAVWGLAGRPSLARGTNKGQFVFVNGRAVREKTIQHAIREAYRGLIDPSRYPTCVVLVEMDPRAVDVNVHPAKAEVRFRDSSMVHSVVLGALRDALRAADLTPSLAQATRAVHGPVDAQDLAAALRSPPGDGSSHPSSPGVSPGTIRDALADPPIPVPIPARRVLQVHKSFLVAEDEQGITIIDQHALHERVMFEQLLERVARGTLETQRLLAPAIVPASTERLDALAGLAPLLSRLGMEVEPFGPDTLAIHAFPSFLFDRGVEPEDFLSGLLDKALSGAIPPDGEEALREVLDMMACKAAVKAGDRLSDDELSELVRLRGEVERSSSCPHGRPTSIHLTIRELEKLFQRR